MMDAKDAELRAAAEALIAAQKRTHETRDEDKGAWAELMHAEHDWNAVFAPESVIDLFDRLANAKAASTDERADVVAFLRTLYENSLSSTVDLSVIADTIEAGGHRK